MLRAIFHSKKGGVPVGRGGLVQQSTNVQYQHFATLPQSLSCKSYVPWAQNKKSGLPGKGNEGEMYGTNGKHIDWHFMVFLKQVSAFQ